MNRILETDLLSLTGAKSLDPLSPPRRTPGQGEAFRFSLTEAGTERSASVAETDRRHRAAGLDDPGGRGAGGYANA